MKRGGVHVSVRRVVPGAAVLRAARLLDMMYKPSELAEELKIRQRAIYDVLVPLGLPHERDEHGHIWLHGQAVRAWLETATRGPKYELGDDELFCLRCFEPRRVSPEPPLSPPRERGGSSQEERRIVNPAGSIANPAGSGGAELVREGKFVMVRAKCPECGAMMYKGVGKRQARRLAAAGLIDESELSIFEEASK